MDDIEGALDTVLEDIAYLARSRNRVRLLQALVSAPGSSRALRDRTGTSKTTCNRILNEFVERAWARQTSDGTYEATATADHVVRQFRPFAASLATLRSLGPEVALLPADELAWGPDGEMTLGLHHFADATVRRKRPQQQGVGRTAIADAFRTTGTLHTITDGAPPRIVGEVLQERARRGDLSGTVVFTTALFEYLRDHHEGPPDWAALIEAGVDIYRYDGATPDNLTVTEEATFIWGELSDGTTSVLISRNDAVRRWGVDVVDRYRARADRITLAAFE